MTPIFAKRKGPATVASVEHAGIQYVVEHWKFKSGLNHNGGYIEARDAKSGAKLWGLRVYAINQNPNLESDVQDLFIVSMTLDDSKKRLIIRNEANHTYWVDLAQRTATFVYGASK